MQAQARHRSTSSIRRTNHAPATTAATAARGLDERVQTLIAVTGPVKTKHAATDPDSSAAAAAAAAAAEAASFATAARTTAAKGVRCALVVLPGFGRIDVLGCRHLPEKRTCHSRRVVSPGPLGCGRNARFLPAAPARLQQLSGSSSAHPRATKAFLHAAVGRTSSSCTRCTRRSSVCEGGGAGN